MSIAKKTFSGDGTQLVCTVFRKEGNTPWRGLFFAHGTWGGGTIAWQWSYDGGTTKLEIKDASGVPLISSADDSFTSDFVGGLAARDNIQIYAVLSGSTSPSLSVGVIDDNN